MKTAFLATLFLCSTIYLAGQNLSGHWIGRLYQNDVGWYDFELQLTSNGQGTYLGTSYISCERGSGTMALHARQDSTGFHFQESQIRDEHWTTMGWYWCIKTGSLQIIQNQDSLVMSGDWNAPGTCQPGTLRLTKAYKTQEKTSAKPELPSRKVETKDILHIGDGEVLVEIWDNEKEDGDIASISLNGEVVLSNHLVTLKKYPFLISLQPGKNVLVLHAENLGKRPPNTAAITIHYDGKIQTVVLNSDKTTSQAIEIIH